MLDMLLLCFVTKTLFSNSNLTIFQISCIPSSHCNYETGVDPIPVSHDGELQISLHLNLLGEPNSVSGPMEIGESIAIQCSDPG